MIVSYIPIKKLLIKVILIHLSYTCSGIILNDRVSHIYFHDLDYTLKSCIHPSHESASKKSWMHIVKPILPKYINQLS